MCIGIGYTVLNKKSMFLCKDDEGYIVQNKRYFNKTTRNIKIINGIECDNFLNPISEKNIIKIIITYEVNYSNFKLRDKSFIFVDDVLYKDTGEICNRIPKEIKTSLEEYKTTIKIS